MNNPCNKQKADTLKNDLMQADDVFEYDIIVSMPNSVIGSQYYAKASEKHSSVDKYEYGVIVDEPFSHELYDLKGERQIIIKCKNNKLHYIDGRRCTIIKTPNNHISEKIVKRLIMRLRKSFDMKVI